MGRLGMGLAAAALGALALASGASARPFSSTGSFVIGDQSANVGSTVTFWGAQWWKDNDLSGGTAPAVVQRLRRHGRAGLRRDVDDAARQQLVPA